MIAFFVLSLLLQTIGPSRNVVQMPAFDAAKQSSPAKMQNLERLDQPKLEKLIRTRKGRALFINVWATWCEPCVQEFPDIVRLSNEMKDQQIDFVGVSGDYIDDEASKVIPFIEKQKASFKFYIAKLEGEDAFINAFDPKWGGGIPATFTYDAKGHLRAFLEGRQSYESLKAAAEKALKK